MNTKQQIVVVFLLMAINSMSYAFSGRLLPVFYSNSDYNNSLKEIFLLQEKNDFDKVDSLYQTLLNQLSNTEDTIHFLNVLMYYGEFNFLVNKYEKAGIYYFNTLNNSFNYFEKEEDARIKYNIALWLEMHHEFDAALNFYKQAFDYYQSDQDSLAMAFCLNGIGKQYSFNYSLDTAQNIFQHALSLYTQLNDTVGIAITNALVGEVFFRQNNYDDALKLFNESLTVFTLKNLMPEKNYTVLLIANVYLRQKHFQKAYSLMLDNNEDINSTKNTFLIIDWYKMFSEILTGLNDFENAYKYAVYSNELLEKVNKYYNKLNVDEMLYAYSEKFYTEKEKLLTEEYNLNQQIIKKQRIITYSILFIILVLILLTTIVLIKKQKIKIRN